MAVATTGTSNSFRRTANLPSATAFSMGGWFYIGTDRNTYTGFMTLCNSTGGSPSEYNQLATESDGTTLSIWTLGSSTTLLALSVNTWYFIALTNSGTGAGACIGYARALTSNALTSASRQGDSFTPALAEWGNDGFGDYLNGRMHSLWMADAVLSAAELLEISYYHEAQLRGIRSLNVFYPTIESVNTNANIDRSGNGRNASATVGAIVDAPPLLWVPSRLSQPVFVTTGGGGGTTHTKTVTENVAAEDALPRSVIRGRVVSALAQCIDHAPFSVIRGRATVDAVSISDDFIAWSRRVRDAADVLSIDDSVLYFARRVRVVNEALSIVDQLIASISAGIITKVLTDVVSIEDSYLRHLRVFRLVTDALEAVDQLVSWSHRVRQPGETVTLTDIISRTAARGRIVSEAVVVTDQQLRAAYMYREVLESVEINDEVARFRFSVRMLSELLEVSESVVSTLVPFITYQYDVRQNIGLDEVAHIGLDCVGALGLDEVATLGVYH